MKIGNLDITNPKIGTTPINKVFIGVDQVWPNLLMDEVTGSTGGYSLRRLTNLYSGSAIQVRRSSDNTTQDIGFVNNELDTASLLAFCSGINNGQISIWYDQSGNGNNLIQPTYVNQFLIVSLGSLISVNGKPALYGVEDFLQNSTKTASSTSTVFTVHKGDSNTTNTNLVGFPASTDRQIGLYYWGSGSKPFGFNTWAGDSWGYNNSTSDFDSQSLWTALFKEGNITTSGVKIYRNGTQKTLSQVKNSSTATRIIDDGFNVGIGGSQSGQQESNGYYQEVVIYDADYSTTNRNAIEDNINNFYSIY